MDNKLETLREDLRTDDLAAKLKGVHFNDTLSTYEFYKWRDYGVAYQELESYFGTLDSYENSIWEPTSENTVEKDFDIFMADVLAIIKTKDTARMLATSDDLDYLYKQSLS